MGSPNSDYNEGLLAMHHCSPKKERTGETRLLRGCGGSIGTIMRRIMKAEAIKEMKARTRAGMSGIIVFRSSRRFLREREDVGCVRA